MRRQPRIIHAALGAAAAVAAMAGAVRADTAATFANFATDVSLNAGASFNSAFESGANSTGALALDPTNADALYVINRTASSAFFISSSGTYGNGGAYAYSLSAHARLTSPGGANVYLSNNVAGLPTWSDTSGDPYSATVGNDGSLYLLFNSTPGLYKVANPLSDTPAATKIFGNYNGATDDDPAYVARMPAAFLAGNAALAGYSTDDLLVFDFGLDADRTPGVVAVHADGSDGASPLVVWRASSAGTATARAGVDPRTGSLYYINVTPESNTINGTGYLSLYRVNGDGTRQTIGLKLPAGAAITGLDDAIAVNPADGSVWIANIDSGTNRTVYRIDTQYLSDQGDGQFLAPVTTAFTATHFNLGVNSLVFSPDGKTLYAGTPDGTDKVWAFATLVHSPGDANGDGRLDADDFALIDRGFAAHLAGWTNGDFNVDGVVDAADYLILDTAYGQSHALAPGFLDGRQARFGDAYVAELLAAVPEPGGLLAACGLAVPALVRRRSRASIRTA